MATRLVYDEVLKHGAGEGGDVVGHWNLVERRRASGEGGLHHARPTVAYASEKRRCVWIQRGERGSSRVTT